MFRESLIVLLCGVVLWSPPLPALGQAGGRRQYYNSWAKHPSKSYYYRTYYYKKSPRSPSYSYHYGIYYPSRGKRVYMYNPHKKRYWGYWDGNKYSLLDPKYRRESINDIRGDHGSNHADRILEEERVRAHVVDDEHNWLPNRLLRREPDTGSRLDGLKLRAHRGHDR